MDPFPTEILLVILEQVWNRQQLGRKSLCSCSAVCSKWRPIAQALLFTEVILQSKNQAKNFLLAIQGTSSLGHATKILKFGPDALELYPPNHVAEVRLPISDITAHCPKLYQLNLDIPSDMGSDVLRTLLHSQTFMALRALSLSIQEASSTSGVILKLDDILQFLHRFSSLSHLFLHNFYVLRSSAPFLTHTPFPTFQLYEFGWISDDPRFEPSSLLPFNFIANWLFESSSEGPLIFLLDDFDQDESNVLTSFLRSHGERLISVRTAILAQDLASMPITISDACPNLQELVLNNNDLTRSSIRSTLPIARLKHLGCAMMERGSADEKLMTEVAEWTMSLPAVQYATCYIETSSANPDPPGVKLWKEKYANRIELEVLSDDDNVWDQDDPIRATHFPRGKTIANLSRMTLQSMPAFDPQQE